MPYSLRKKGNKWEVVNTATGDVKGSFEVKSIAQKQINLLRGIEHGWEPTGKPARKRKK